MAINKVQLATYPDSLGGYLRSMNHVLNKYFSETFKGGIHITSVKGGVDVAVIMLPLSGLFSGKAFCGK